MYREFIDKTGTLNDIEEEWVSSLINYIACLCRYKFMGVSKNNKNRIKMCDFINGELKNLTSKGDSPFDPKKISYAEIDEERSKGRHVLIKGYLNLKNHEQEYMVDLINW